MAISFRKEFQCLPRPHAAMMAGRANKDLNNNPNVLPYDVSRVVLDHDGTGQGDYINAR
jgi:protein tyrosine phosphatase